jgi:hypothetical protein
VLSSRGFTLKATLIAWTIALVATVPAQAAPPEPGPPCEVGKYYKLCVWSGPGYTGQLRVLPYNVDRLDIGPLFVIRSYKNWHASGRITDVFGCDHGLGEWEKEPAVNDGWGIPAKAIASGSS